MKTLDEIKAAIPSLSLEERADVARSLHNWADDAWDTQIKQDLTKGKLRKMLAKVDVDIAKGNLRDLP